MTVCFVYQEHAVIFILRNFCQKNAFSNCERELCNI